MENGLTQEQIDKVVEYIAEHPKCSASSIPGEKDHVLKVLRVLNRIGRIKGIIHADMTKIGSDSEGPHIADAVGLELK